MAKTAARNKSAYYNFSIIKKFEAGICLKGCEVKSLRGGQADIKQSFAKIIEGEIFLLNAHIAPYDKASGSETYDPLRPRKLLLNRNEIRQIEKKIQTKGLTLVPIEIYFKRGKAKVSIGLAEGKTKTDKRQAIKKRITEREMDREKKRYTN